MRAVTFLGFVILAGVCGGAQGQHFTPIPRPPGNGVSAVPTGSPGTLPLEWLRDSSNLDPWTGQQLINGLFGPDAEGVWGWRTGFGQIRNQRSTFRIVPGMRTITAVELDNRPMPGAPDEDVRRFQLRYADADTDEEFWQVAATFTAAQQPEATYSLTTPRFQSFTLPQPVRARYLCLWVLDNYDANHIQAREWRVYGHAPAPPAAPLFALGLGILIRRFRRDSPENTDCTN